MAGAYRSVFKGRGLDFEDVRGYTAGDDVRFIDWNVTARMHEPYVREFTEERELSVMIAVDVSASGELASGAQSKRELAAEVAATMAFSAVANGDKVGLLLFSERVEKYLPPRKGRPQGLRIIRDVLQHAGRHRGTSLREALKFLNHVQRRRAIVFLISDFIDDGFDRVLKATAHHHDLVPLSIGDPREEALPDVGRILVEDAESGELMEIDTSDPALRETFAQRAAEEREALRHRFLRMGTDGVFLRTGESCQRALQNYMERRMSRRLG